MTDGSTFLIVAGAVWYWLGWSAAERTPNRNGAGEWPSAPRPIWRLLRRGPGPPLIGAIALEVIGITWTLVGLLRLADVPSALDSSFMPGSAVLLAVTWLLVELRGRWRD